MGEPSSSTDPTPVLRQLAQRLHQSHSGIDLNDKVERDETIGPLKGGYAFVYQGTSSGRRVAIKIVHSVPLGDEKSIKCVLREVYVWSKLRHPNIVPLLGITTKFDHGVAIVSEWMDKGNAFDYVQSRDIDPRPLLKDIANALRYLHEHAKGPIIHGDLKGQNVLISKDGRGLLTDFGLSTLVNSSFSMATSAHHGGTPAWLAPEVISGSPNTKESDVWAYGMTALELFTAKRPYHNVERIPAIMFKILNGPPQRPSDETTCARMTDEWWDLCSLCWRKDPSSRPAVSEIIEKLGREEYTQSFFNHVLETNITDLHILVRAPRLPYEPLPIVTTPYVRPPSFAYPEISAPNDEHRNEIALLGHPTVLSGEPSHPQYLHRLLPQSALVHADPPYAVATARPIATFVGSEQPTQKPSPLPLLLDLGGPANPPTVSDHSNVAAINLLVSPEERTAVRDLIDVYNPIPHPSDPHVSVPRSSGEEREGRHSDSTEPTADTSIDHGQQPPLQPIPLLSDPLLWRSGRTAVMARTGQKTVAFAPLPPTWRDNTNDSVDRPGDNTMYVTPDIASLDIPGSKMENQADLPEPNAHLSYNYTAQLPSSHHPSRSSHMLFPTAVYNYRKEVPSSKRRPSTEPWEADTGTAPTVWSTRRDSHRYSEHEFAIVVPAIW